MVFSVGENSYGHPVQVIIDDLIVEGISYHRIDEAKNIGIKMYKNKFIIKGHKTGNNVIIK